MTDPALRYQTMFDFVKQRGGRMTSHRIALLRLLAVSEGHPNASQIYEQLREQFPTISIATVYKTLALLKEEGQVLEIDLHNDSRYDGNKPYPHPHLICKQCGLIIDGDAVASLSAINQDIQEHYQFQVMQAQMVFYGLCRACQSG